MRKVTRWEYAPVQALEMFKTKDTRNALVRAGNATPSRKNPSKYERDDAEEWSVGMQRDLPKGALSQRASSSGAGPWRLSDQNRENKDKAADKGKDREREREREREKERDGERERERERERESERERERVRVREKEREMELERETRAQEAEAWTKAVVDEASRGDASGVPCLVAPRLLQLKNVKVAHDPSKAHEIVQALNDVAKRCPHVFAMKEVVDTCLDLLSWSPGLSAPRDGIVQHQLVCRWLLAGHQDVDLWPISMVQAYLEDAMENRRWVDIPHASSFVANVITAFPSLPKEQEGGGLGKGRAEHDPKRRKMAGGSSRAGGQTLKMPRADCGAESEQSAVAVRPRFREAGIQKAVSDMAIAAVKKNLDQPLYGDTAQRKLQTVLRVLLLLVPYERVRHEAMKRLESWLNNPNLVRQVKELMPRLATQCILNTEMEAETLRLMLRMRPKANAIQMHNEAVGIMCRCNKTFPFRALMTSVEIEMKDYDGFSHKNNKTLRHSHAISTIFKCSGVPHLTIDLPENMGGGVELLNTMDLGIGQIDYDVRGALRLWSSVMKDDDCSDATGLVLVAVEDEVCLGLECESGSKRLETAARRAHQAHASALVVIASRALRGSSSRSWNVGSLALPVLAISPREDIDLLKELIHAGMNCNISRLPRETLLASCIQVLADGDKRAGLPLLLRKILKTGKMVNVPDLDLVALSENVMTPHANVHSMDADSKCLWASTLVDVVAFICIYLSSCVIESGQAPVHAERGVGSMEQRSERVAAVVRGQVMRIIEVLLDSWVQKVLKTFISREQLTKALRKLLFYDEASSYGVDPLFLETHERQGIRWLQNEMGVSERSLIALAHLGLCCDVDKPRVLELLEVLVRRALPAACRDALHPAKDNSAKHNLVLSEGGMCLWEMVPELARSFGTETGHSELVPRPAALQAYLILLILGVLNPQTLGKVAWECPTMRALMHMLITASFTLSVDQDMFEHHPLARLPALETEALRNDQEEIAQARAKLLREGLPEPKWLDDAQILKLSASARCPPLEFQRVLKLLDTENGLGLLLRKNAPEMLFDTIASAPWVGWLRAILERHPETANSLPVPTICQLLLESLCDVSESCNFQAPEFSGDKYHNVISLAMRLAESICNTERDDERQGDNARRQQWVGLLFFLDHLSDEDEGKRRRAVMALGLVLSSVDHIRFSSSKAALDSAQTLHSAVDSDVEEELLVGGGGLGHDGDQEVLASGGGSYAIEVFAGGDKDACREESRNRARIAGPYAFWLNRLRELTNVPSIVREKVVLVLRGALMKETEVNIVLHYLEYLLQTDARLCSCALGCDVAHLVLRRNVLVLHLSKLPGATSVLIQILRMALKVVSADDSTARSSHGEMVKVPGGTGHVPLVIVRAGLQTLCLPETEPNDGRVQPSQTGERDELMRLLLPNERALVDLASGIPDDEMEVLMRAPCEHMVACAVTAATPQQLAVALSSCGLSAVTLAKVVVRFMGLQESSIPPISQTLRRGLGARAVFMLKRGHPREAQWLSNMLGIQISAPKKLLRPQFSRIRASKEIDISVPHGCLTAGVGTHPTLLPATRGPPAFGAVNSALLKVPARTLLSELVEKVEGAHIGDQQADSCAGGDGPFLRWQSVVECLVESEKENEDERGLQMDFLSAVNPLLWFHLDAGKQTVEALIENVFRLRPAACAAKSCVRRASVMCGLFEPHIISRAQPYQSCRQWLLGKTMLNTSTGAMHAMRSEAGVEVLGPELDCDLCLQVLSTCIIGESGPFEGAWGEGGGGEVLETRTRRENLRLSSSLRVGAAGSAASEAECVALAHFIVSEGCNLGGVVAMGRMQLLVSCLNDSKHAALAVSRALLALIPVDTRQDAAMGCEFGLGVEQNRLALAAADVLERLRKALPMPMSCAPIPTWQSTAVPILEGRQEHEEEALWKVLQGSLSLCRTQQTSRLDRMLHSIMAALQDDGRAASALHVARQLSATQPSLVANRMLLLKGMCAGKVRYRLSDFVERGHHKLFLNILALLEASAPHSLRCNRLPIVLDEFFLLFSSIVRYEAVLQPLLLRLSSFLLQLIQLKGSAATYVNQHIRLLTTLAAWYLDISDLTAVLDLLDSDASPTGTVALSMTVVDPQASRVEQVVAILALKRCSLGVGLGNDVAMPVIDASNNEADDVGSPGIALMRALEEAEVLTGPDVRMDLKTRRLQALESPMIDLLESKASSVRGVAYRILFRSAFANPSCAWRFADRHIECLMMDDDAVRRDAIAHSAEMTVACALAASRVLWVLFRMARSGNTEAKAELLRATQLGLDFHCIPSR